MEAQDSLIARVEEFLDSLRAERGASPHTIAAYRNDLRAIVMALESGGAKDWAGLGSDDERVIETHLAAMPNRRSAARRATALRSFLKSARREGLDVAIEAPATGFRVGHSLPKARSRDEIVQLLGAVRDGVPTEIGLRDRALVAIVYGAGLRISEAINLELAGVLSDERRLRINGKRGKTRIVPLPLPIWESLDLYLRSGREALIKSPTSLIFLSDRGRPLLRQRAATILSELAQAAGISPLSPHTLRHSYAVHLLTSGADLRSVQELLGHESVGTTQIYTALQIDEVRRRYRKAHPRA